MRSGPTSRKGKKRRRPRLWWLLTDRRVWIEVSGMEGKRSGEWSQPLPMRDALWWAGFPVKPK